ncbi:hypothetical protein B4U80_02003, partial [Leptotrombidium deliense]
MKNYSLITISFILCCYCVKWIKCEEYSCHMRAIDKCIYPWFYFTHRPGATGIATTRYEFELMC